MDDKVTGDDAGRRWKFDVTWILVLIQFIVILFLIIALFAYILTRPIEFHAQSTKSFESLAPYEGEANTFHRRVRVSTTGSMTTTTESTTTSSSTAKIDFSEDVHPQSESSETYDSFHAAVLSESSQCSELGRSILVRGGNAMDAALCTAFCMMMAAPNKASLGGGVLMMIRDANGTMRAVIARESAPMLTNVEELRNSPQLTQSGAKSIGVPGMMNGLFRAFETFSSGRISWKQLIIPTLQQCVKGFEYGKKLEREVELLAKRNRNATKLLDCSILATALSDLTDFENPLEGFIIPPIGYLSAADFEDYESDVTAARCALIDSDVKVCGPGPPSLFSLLVNSYLLTKNMSNIEKVNEVVKSNINTAYKISDPIFNQSSKKHADDLMKSSKKSAFQKDMNIDFREDGSTTISVVDENNMTVSVILSLGDLFGSEVVAASGFLMNNKLRYFDLKSVDQPLSLQPGKVPTTMTTPFLVLKNDVVLAVSGGADLVNMVHLLRDLTHRNYDASIATPALYLSNSAIILKSHPSHKYSVTGY